jgi:hypothetical protein
MQLRLSFVSLILGFALLVQSAPAFAGTTGTLSGTVTETGTASPIADASVTVSSPSQTATTTTDAIGHFVFLSLAPDTYTVSVDKNGYDPVSRPGITILADQTRITSLGMVKSLKTIASVRSQAATALVKPGTTSDVYSVNPETMRQTAVLGGGGNLNNAYSAITSVPGTYVPQGQQGYGQALYIRGGDYYQIGYEYDGVPVNRSFDNYAGGSLSNLGQQELQVYTGGAPAGSSAAAISGFINQVIRTGTYPGFGTIDASVGSPTFYHKLNVEAGGASPSRLFSYYAGIGTYNQGFRLFDQFNGGGTHPELGYASVLNSPFNTSAVGLPTGVVPTCVAGSSGFGTTYLPAGANDPGCFAFGPGFVSFGANVQPAAGPGSGGFFFAQENSRDAVVNLHFGLPHKKDSGRDDVQALWTAGALWSPIYTSQNDIGLQTVFNAVGPPFMHPECVSPTGTLICNSTLAYDDPSVFPPGTRFGQDPTGLGTVPYFQPSSPQHAPFALISPIARDGYINNQDIVKLQYQKNFSTNAYLRIYGYTFYSDWLINGPNYNGLFIPTAITAQFGNYGPMYGGSPDYELSTHTRGAELQYAAQLGPKDLINLTANYTTASTIRANNTSLLAIAGSNSRATNDTDGVNCFDATGAIAPCNTGATAGTYTNPTPFTPVNGQWIVTNNVPRATFNNVIPRFFSYALSNQFRPNDRWLFNTGIRFENFNYDLGNTQDNGKNFWFTAGQREFCYDPATLEVSFAATLTCAGTMVHPDGLNGHRLLSNNYPGLIDEWVFSPRFAFTYTFSPDAVLRASYGRYSQPVNAAFVQYNRTDPNLAKFLFQTFWKYGFTTPRHDVVASISDNADLSLEYRLHGTDLSFKLTPYYRSTENQLQQFFLDPSTGFVSGLNVGHQISYGLEFQLQKGDFTRNGFSGLISYTYTKTHISYTDFRSAAGRNVIDVLNDSIIGYNQLTSACAGASAGSKQCGGVTGTAAPCYTSAGDGTPDPACGPTSIRNPYFNQAPQPLLDRSGQYYPFDLFPAVPQYSGLPANITNSFYVPNVVAAVLNYRVNKLAITPSFVFTSGNPYGAPLDTPGIDPRFCTGNSTAIPTSPDPLKADYTTCAAPYVSVPNPENGNRFTSLGQFRNPDQFTINLALTYDISPKISANVIVANLYNRCFGGTATPWTAAFPPGGNICSYGSNGFAPSPIATNGGFWNGSGPNDVAANGVPLNPYLAHTYQPIGYTMPFEAFFSIQVKF